MVALERDESLSTVCARSLRTQQRAKSRCQKPCPKGSDTDLGSDRDLGQIPLVESGVLVYLTRGTFSARDQLWPAQAPACAGFEVDANATSVVIEQTSTESLILAQDERWRRA